MSSCSKKFLTPKKDGLLYLNDPLVYSIEPLSSSNLTRKTRLGVGGPRVGGRRQAADSVLGEINEEIFDGSAGPCRLEPHLPPSPPGKPPSPALFDGSAGPCRLEPHLPPSPPGKLPSSALFDSQAALADSNLTDHHPLPVNLLHRHSLIIRRT